MDYNLSDIIDIPEFQKLMDSCYEANNIPFALIDVDHKIHVACGWQRICTMFHRKCPETERLCKISDSYIAKHLYDAPYAGYQCENGLMDYAIPLIIEDKHIGTVFTGQFFHEKPDESFFRKQAQKYGFDEEEYIKALYEVPIFEKEKVEKTLVFLRNITHQLAKNGLDRLNALRSKRALAKSEQMFRGIFEQSAVGVAIVNTQNKILKVNQKFCDMLGYTKDELQNLRVQDITHPDEKESLSVLQKQAQGKIENYSIEKRYLKKNGECFWGNVTATTIKDENGKIDFFVGIIIDISEKKTAEIDLQKSELRFRELFEESPIGLWEEDYSEVKKFINNLNIASDKALRKYFSDNPQQLLDCVNLIRINNVNKSLLKIFKVDNQKMLIDNFPRFFNKDTLKKLMDAICALTSGISMFDSELTCKDYNGNTIWLSLRLQILPGYEETWSKVLISSFDITDKKQTEKALIESEAKLLEAQQMAKIGYWYWDVNTGDVEWSDEVYNIFRLDSATFAPQIDSIVKMIPSNENINIDQKLIQKAIDNHEQGSYEQIFNRANGETGYYYSTYQGIYDKNNDLVAIQGTVQDITERKMVEIALKESESFNKLILNSTPDIIYIYDVIERKNIYSNNGAEKILGYTPAEIQELGNQLIPTLMHPDDFKVYLTQTLSRYKTAKDNELIEHEYRMKRKNGDWVWLQSREYIFARQDDGSPKHIFGVIRDINDYKESEELREKSEEKYRALFKNMLNGFAYHKIITNDKGEPIDYIFLEVNDAFEKLTGLKRENIVGKKVTEVLPGTENDPANWIEFYGKVALTGKELRFDNYSEILQRWYSIYSFSPLENYFAVLFEDITERRQLEEQLRQSEKMQAIGQLAGGIAHDYNNQLAAIMGYSDLLSMELTDSKLKKYAENIVKVSIRAKDLTQQLLAFARKGKYQQIKINMHNIIHEVVDILMHSIDKKIQIKQHLEAPHFTIIGDPTQIQNTVLNIAINARDAMPNGGKLIFATETVQLDEIYCSKQPYEINPGNYLRISISDSGTGIDKKIQMRIFEPFFTTKEIGKGTGMGLAAVYGAVKSHKGAISVYSEPDKGTTFSLYLPLSKNVHKEYTPKTESRKSKGSGKVLLVDDEDIVISMATAMLTQIGYDVVSKMNGNEAVEYYKTNWKDIDVVLLDMVMPIMAGEETFAEMKKTNPNIKCILSSGFSLDGEAHKIIAAGVSNFIQKPYTTTELTDILNTVLFEE